MRTERFYSIDEQNESLNRFRTSKNAKAIFDFLDFDKKRTVHGKISFTPTEYTETILDIVEKMCNGFVVDICKRFKYGAEFGMSEKQKWCVAYAFCKIDSEINLNEIYTA